MCKKKGKIMIFILVLLLLLPTTVFGAERMHDARSICVLELEGDEEGLLVKRGAKKTFVASEGTKLGAGDTLTTNGEAICYLAIDEDKIVKMAKNTIISISRASTKKLRITLTSGNLFFNVKKPLPKDSTLEFKAGSTVMGVRGTSGFFGKKQKDIQVVILNGEVELDNGISEKTSVKGGFYELVKPDGTAEGSPRPIKANQMPSFVMGTVVEEITRPVEEEEEIKRQEEIKRIFEIEDDRDIDELKSLQKDREKAEEEEELREEEREKAEELREQAEENLPDYDEDDSGADDGDVEAGIKDSTGDVGTSDTSDTADDGAKDADDSSEENDSEPDSGDQDTHQ